MGDTTSSDFPTANPTQAAPGGNGDGFVAQLSADGSALSFSTYLGGTSTESAYSVAADATVVDVAGVTGSSDFPTVRAFQPAFGTSNQDAFVTSYVIEDLLLITKTASPTLVAGGEPITYTLTVQNPGTVGAATGVTVTDPLPTGVAFVSAGATQGNCAQSAGTVNCTLGVVAANTTATVTIKVMAPTISTQLTNTATVTANEGDPHPANNAATAVVYVNAVEMSLTKTAFPSVAAFGQPVFFTLTVTNNGSTNATGVRVVDPLPANVAFRSARPSQGKCTQLAGTVRCSLGALAPGAHATVTIKVGPSPGRITNTSTVSGDQVDTDTTNNTATASVFALGAGCGQVISKNTTVAADIGPCRGDGLIVGANNITLDLGGHRIFGFGPSSSGTHPGIRLPDRFGVTIKNGAISDFDAGILFNSGGNNTVTNMNIHDNIGPDIPGFGSQLGDGIAVIHSANNVITGNTINHNGTYDGIGIFGLDANFNLVQGNTITNTVGSVVDHQDGEGIALNSLLAPTDPRRGGSIYGNNIIANTIVGNQAAGIVNTSNVNATIKANDIERNGLDFNTQPNDGIMITYDFNAIQTTNDLLQDNKVVGNGADGIQLRVASGNRVVNNRTGGNDANLTNLLGTPSFDLDDRSPNCDSNVWRGNTWGSGGYNQLCVTAGGSGPPPPAPKPAAPAAPADQSSQLRLRPDIPL